SPPAAWESLVKTGKARAAIRRATRAAVRNQYAGLGRRIIERLCQRAKMVYSEEKLAGALARLARASIEDVMAAVGRGEMRAANEPGSLAQVSQGVGNDDGTSDNVRMARQSPYFTSVTIALVVHDIKHRSSIIAQLRARSVVAGADRVNA